MESLSRFPEFAWLPFVVDEFRSSVKSWKSFKVSQLVAGLDDLSEQVSNYWYPFLQLELEELHYATLPSGVSC